MSEAAPATLDTTTTPAVSDLLQPQPMTPEAALAKKVEFLGNKDIRERIISWHPETVRQWREVTRALSPLPIRSLPKAKTIHDNMDSPWRFSAKPISRDAVRDHVAAGGPVSSDGARGSLVRKGTKLQGQGWVTTIFGRRQAGEL